MAEVVCLGILVADVVTKPVDKLPDRGKLMQVDTISLHTGGCAANTGIGLGKIGVETAIIGKVGADGFGEFMIQRAKANGVGADGIVRTSEASTSATVVMVHPDGERSFVHYVGANAALREEDVTWSVIEKSKVLHVAGTFLMPSFDGQPTANVLKRARELGLITVLDTAWDATGRWMELIEPALPWIDYFVPSLAEAQQVTGREDPAEVADVLVDHGVKTVGLKMGEEGCYIRQGDTRLSIPPFEVDCVDATGAGDAFAAGFLTGVARGWDLERTGRFANAVGGLCVTALGATDGLRSMEQTEEFMRNTPLKS